MSASHDKFIVKCIMLEDISRSHRKRSSIEIQDRSIPSSDAILHEWAASSESISIPLAADVTGIDNPITSITAEGMDMNLTLAKADDLVTGGEHWTVTAPLTGPFTAGTYNFVFTATDSEGDVVTSDSDGATVVITAD